MQKIVTTGGTLFQIACDYLGDATQWNRIATLNQVDDPWLAGVSTLNIPVPDPNAGGGVGRQ